MNVKETAIAWNYIEKMLSGITDPILRNAYKYELEGKAVREWGYCPSDTQTYKELGEKPQLTKDQQRIVDIIDGYLEYGVDIRTKKEIEDLQRETVQNMFFFVEHNGKYEDIPDDIKCDSLKKLYEETLEICQKLGG